MIETVLQELSFGEREEAGPAKSALEVREERLILTVPEVAELLGVSAWLVHQQVALGVIPCRRLGRRILIPRDRLMSWLEGEE